MKIVGYFEGTDSGVLTKIVASGFCTLPLANEWDGHGKNASHIEPGQIDLIIGYLHKLLPPLGTCEDENAKAAPMGVDIHRGFRPIDLLYPAKAYNIPVLVVVPRDYHKEAKDLLGEAAEFATIVTPEDLEKKVREILEF
ncbi:MAG: hypothetical protein AM325_012150 [Candidatus Thorarchaeota archaeon SMTZ1-45]|nr:MAG: hypothetical protein AM325_13835 [Candidatus Thorarchaeota archaeon SMTZ1-45]